VPGAIEIGDLDRGVPVAHHAARGPSSDAFTTEIRGAIFLAGIKNRRIVMVEGLRGSPLP